MAGRAHFLLLLPAFAAAWLWLTFEGSVLVVDESKTVLRAGIVTGKGRRPLHPLPDGLFAGLPGCDGVVELTCRDGSRREIGYVTGSVHTWVKVRKGGPCGVAEEML